MIRHRTQSSVPSEWHGFSSPAISEAGELAQTYCRVLLLCWNVVKDMPVAHSFLIAFLGYGETALLVHSGRYPMTYRA